MLDRDRGPLEGVPFLRGVDIAELGKRVKSLGIQGREEAEHSEGGVIEGILDVREASGSVNTTERLKAPLDIAGHYAKSVASGGCRKKSLQQVSVGIGHITGNNQIQITSAARESGFKSCQRAESGPQIAQLVKTELGVSFRRAHKGHVAGSSFDLGGDVLNQSTGIPGQQRLICSHSRTSPTNQHEASGSHEKMVALADRCSGYNWTNKVRLSCLIALLSASAALGAGLSGPDAPAAVISVVRVGPNGHLIRVVRSTKAHETARTKSDSVPQDIQELVTEASKRYEVDPLLVHSVMHAESNFNPLAMSPKGAQGLMQLIPATAQRFGAADPMDPKQNIEAGVRYLKYLQKRFPDDLTLAIAAYNAGEGAVSRYKTVPPYRETLSYVRKVSSEYRSGLIACTSGDAAQRSVSRNRPCGRTGPSPGTSH